MKRILGIALVAGVVAAGLAEGAMLEKGTHELYLSGSGHPGGAMSMSARYGRFIAQGLELGASVGGGTTRHSSWLASGVFAERSFDLGSTLVPFVGTSFRYRTTTVQVLRSDAEDAAAEADGEPERIARRTQGFLAGASAGAKYFVAHNAALSGAVHVDVPSDSSLRFNTNPENVHVSFVVATRFFF